MTEEKKPSICPVERAVGLDNSFRKLLQNPKKLLTKYISQGMTVLDLGCGPGFFSIEIAKMLNGSGRVIAADLQEGMLDKVNLKIKGTELDQRIELHKCQDDSIDINDKVDFILAFYMIHEVPNQNNLFKELKSILNPNGKIYIVEPKFHVSKKKFSEMINRTKDIGFKVIDMPKVFFSRTVLLSI